MHSKGALEKFLAFIIIILIFFNVSLKAQKVTQTIPEKTRLLFLLDGSASMFGEWEKTIKIRAARSILSDLIDSLRSDPNLELALRIYGNTSPPEDRNCTDTKLEVPFRSNNHDLIIEKIRNLEPKGTTPIAYSLEQAASDFPVSSEYRNILIIITDGIESCGGDPCKISIELQRRGVFLRPFIIGMNMDEDYQKQFDCVGSYFDARKIRDFISVLNLALEQSMAKTTVTVELLDQELQPTETNVTVSFLNHLTREPVYEFVHYRDKNNITDTLEIEPILTYDVIANTIPPVERKRVDIIGGRHNEIKLETPQGFLNITMRDYMKYENGVHALIKKPGTKEVIHVQGVPNTEKYLTGIYDVEVLTLPKTLFKNVEVTHQKTTKLSLADPGLVNFISSSYIFATIFQIQGKKESWVTNLDTKNTTTTLAMQPGDYKIALRTKDTYGSKFTEIKYFKVNSRQSTSIKFFD